MSEAKLLNQAVIGLAVFGILLLAFLVLKPILIPIIFALLLAYVFRPLYIKIHRWVKRPNLAAIILMLIVALVIAIPLVYFTPLLIRQVFDIYLALQHLDLGSVVSSWLPSFLEEEIVTKAGYQINNAIGTIVTKFMNQSLGILINLPDLILKFVVFFFTFFFGVRDYKKIGIYISKISPFALATEKRFEKEFRGITNSIMLGQVLIGIVQGLALGLGLLVLGVSNVLTLTVLTMIIGIIPVLGAWLVWFPVVVALMLAGNITSGLILLFYGAIFVSSLDNFIRPYLLSKSSTLPIGISLVGTIGGLYFLGIIGLILGPLILAYAIIVLEFYRKGKLNELSRD
jgi:predicted PurR-regulated permease PerM